MIVDAANLQLEIFQFPQVLVLTTDFPLSCGEMIALHLWNGGLFFFSPPLLSGCKK